MAVPFVVWLVRRLPGAARPALALGQAPQGLPRLWAACASLLLAAGVTPCIGSRASGHAVAWPTLPA